MAIKIVSAFIDAVTGKVRIEERIVEHSVRNGAAYMAVTADAMIRRGERDRAIELLERGVKLYPNDALIHAQLGRTYAHVAEVILNAGRYAWSYEADVFRMKAVRHLTRASNLKPDDFRFAVNAAYQHELIYQDIRARDLYIRAATIQPLDQHPWVMLGNINARLGHNYMARICYQNAIRIDADTPYVSGRLAQLDAVPDPLSPLDFSPLGHHAIKAQTYRPG